MKKRWIALGTITTITPIITVVSCGVNQATPLAIEQDLIIKSAKSMDKIQEIWQQQVLDDAGQVFDVTLDTNKKPIWVADDSTINKAFNFYIQTESNKGETIIQNLITKITETKEYKDLFIMGSPSVNKDAQIKLWKMDGYWTKGSNTYVIADEAKAFIFKYIPEIRKEVYKLAVSYTFLSGDISKEDYKLTNMDEKDEYLDVQNLISDTSDFVLINEAISQHLFAKWELTSESSNLTSDKFNEEKLTPTEAEAHLVNVTSGTKYNLFTESKLDDRNSKASIIVAGSPDKTTKHWDMLNNLFGIGADTFSGYKGISTMNSGEGILAFTADEYKNVTSKEMWTGWLKDNKLFLSTGTASEIPLFSKNSTKTAGVTKIIGFMPIIKNDKLTFEGTDFALENSDNRDFLILNLAINSSINTKAVNFFTKREKDPILLTIELSTLKDEAIKHGFDFIKED